MPSHDTESEQRWIHLASLYGFKREDTEPEVLMKTASCLWAWLLMLIGLGCAIPPAVMAWPTLAPLLWLHLGILCGGALGLLWYYGRRQRIPTMALANVHLAWLVMMDWLWMGALDTDVFALLLPILTWLASGSQRASLAVLALIVIKHLTFIALYFGAHFTGLVNRNALPPDATSVAVIINEVLFFVSVICTLPILGLLHEWAAAAATASDGFLAAGLQLQRSLRVHEVVLANLLPSRMIPHISNVLHEVVLPADPTQTALLLKRVIPHTSSMAAILFADVVGFTALVERINPEELIASLDAIFTCIDALCEDLEVEKIKTMGDGYMCASIVPLGGSEASSARAVMRLSEALHSVISAFKLGVTKLRFRIGVNCGPVVTGAIGKTKLRYDVFGDSVNVAARMESLGVPEATHVTAEVHTLLKDEYPFVPHGPINVKGKGFLQTYLHFPAVHLSKVAADLIVDACSNCTVSRATSQAFLPATGLLSAATAGDASVSVYPFPRTSALTLTASLEYADSTPNEDPSFCVPLGSATHPLRDPSSAAQRSAFLSVDSVVSDHREVTVVGTPGTAYAFYVRLPHEPDVTKAASSWPLTSNLLSHTSFRSPVSLPHSSLKRPLTDVHVLHCPLSMEEAPRQLGGKPLDRRVFIGERSVECPEGLPFMVPTPRSASILGWASDPGKSPHSFWQIPSFGFKGKAVAPAHVPVPPAPRRWDAFDHSVDTGIASRGSSLAAIPLPTTLSVHNAQGRRRCRPPRSSNRADCVQLRERVPQHAAGEGGRRGPPEGAQDRNHRLGDAVQGRRHSRSGHTGDVW